MIQPQKVLTPEQMRRVDAMTIAAGIPGLILMENAAHRAVEFLAARFGPLNSHRIAVICGKGNNGGDGLAIARLLHVVYRPSELRVALVSKPDEYQGDALKNLEMLRAAGVELAADVRSALAGSTLVVDAVLGTGLRGAAEGDALDAIRKINRCGSPAFSVDIPSGLSGAMGSIPGEFVQAQATVTFTAPKVCHVLAPACDHMGTLHVAGIGSQESMFNQDPAIDLALVTPRSIAQFFAPRQKESNKGRYGHVLIVAGARGKAGAAAMAGLAALRAGAGLVTVACPESVLNSVAGYAPELMTEPLPETASGTISAAALDRIVEFASTRTLTAMGPGIGTGDDAKSLVERLYEELELPLILDADALNCLAETGWYAPARWRRILTPHPGEMGRLTGLSVPDVQADRVGVARDLARKSGAVVVLKGHRTLTAFPDGRVWVNPTGSPAMSTAGTGDILTGMSAGLLAQFPQEWKGALAASVYWHGAAGEIAANRLSEQSVIATDLLQFLGEASRGIANHSN